MQLGKLLVAVDHLTNHADDTQSHLVRGIAQLVELVLPVAAQPQPDGEIPGRHLGEQLNHVA
ncbi:hypothetical protein D9M68_652020 [compost metagenome]